MINLESCPQELDLSHMGAHVHPEQGQHTASAAPSSALQFLSSVSIGDRSACLLSCMLYSCFIKQDTPSQIPLEASASCTSQLVSTTVQYAEVIGIVS